MLSGSNIASSMTISVLFYPVKSIQQVVSSRRSSIVPTTDDEPKIKRNSLPWMQQAVNLLEILYFFQKENIQKYSLKFFKTFSEVTINAQGR